MGGYAKLWTDITNDEWYVSLNGLERSMFFQLIVACKKGGDTGDIFTPSVTALGTEFSISRKSCGKYLAKFAESGTIKLRKTESGQLHIFVVNYHKNQRLRTPKDKPTVGKFATNTPQNNSANKIKEENIREEKLVTQSSDEKEILECFYKKYESHYKTPYVPQVGKDQALVKRLLESLKVQQIKDSIDRLFESNDPFYGKTGGGRTLGVLSANINKLTQSTDEDSSFQPYTKEDLY